MNLSPLPSQFQILSLKTNQSAMFSFRTLTRPTVSLCYRRISTEACFVEVSLTDSNLVEKIEDAIHRNIVKRSEPDWLPFQPGSSYWVPPRRPSYGVAEIIRKLNHPLNRDQAMAVSSLQGWPSSHFFMNNDNQVEDSSSDTVEESNSDAAEGKTSSESSVTKEES